MVLDLVVVALYTILFWLCSHRSLSSRLGVKVWVGLDLGMNVPLFLVTLFAVGSSSVDLLFADRQIR